MMDILFPSKKNKVILTDDGIVRKTFAFAFACENEARMLTALNGCCAPSLLTKNGEVSIDMQYIPGNLLLEQYLTASEEQARRLAHMLAQAMLAMYDKTHGCIPDDENFRNYIVTEGGIFRVDWEEAKKGSLEQWFAKLIAFAVLYQVPPQIKKTFAATLLEGLPADRIQIKKEFEKELAVLCARRGIAPPDDFSSWLFN